MDRKLFFILYAQGHLPSGTIDTVFETLYETEIKPLISALDKYPRINMVFHYSGVLLYWIERRHPEFFMLLEDLLSRKQVEFLGGGFYNPALTLLPLADKIGQIEMLTTYLRKHFGKRPQGCWLPSMTWEQNLVGPLHSCGMSYTFLEEQQFSAAGVKPNAAGFYSPCLTEDQGKLITVFPVSVNLGREFLEGKPKKLIERLLEKLTVENENQVLVFPIGGVEYESLFEALSNVDNGISFTCPARIVKNLYIPKKTYFPGEGALKNSAENKGCPRQFMANNPEAGSIYAKMIHIHTLINNQLRGDRSRKRTAFEELWKAQDSSLFRLGSADSPGLLNSNVRKAAYHSLLEAEKIIREKKKFSPALSVFDYDLDGEGEYIFQEEKLNCCVKSRGAGIFELDYLPATWNYLDTLAPRQGALVGERRFAFVDWLAPAGTLPENFNPEGLKGGRFCGGEKYEVSDTDRLRRKVVFRLPPKAALSWGEIEILKTWQLKKNSIALEYILRNSETKNLTFVFGTSLDLSFPGEGEEFLRIFAIKEGEKEAVSARGGLTARGIKAFEFQDIKNETILTLEASRNFDWRLFHVSSRLPDHDAYQSTCIMPLLQVSLEAGKMWKASFSLKISS